MEHKVMEVKFPERRNDGVWESIYHRYYNRKNAPDMHFPYILNMLKYGGAKVTFIDPEKGKNWQYIAPLKLTTKFEIEIDGKSVLIDLADIEKDAAQSLPIIDKFDAVFVVHWFNDIHDGLDNVYPLCPVNFTDWSLFGELRQAVEFAPTKNKLILNNQRPMGDRWRREKTTKLIKRHYPVQSDTMYYKNNQRKFFMNINNALVSIHIPGCRDDILDRGQTQMFGLGVCTISPFMKETFAGNIEVEAWKHYVPCERDVSDLIDKVEWCKENIDKVKEIGENAKKLFDDNIHPKKLVEWIEKCLN